MNRLLDRELERELDEAEAGGDREISLGLGTILGIFFGLALLCGGVFGLGYSAGRHSVAGAGQAATVASATPGPVLAATKPAPGSAVPAVPSVDESSEAQAVPVANGANDAATDASTAGDSIPSTPAAPVAAVAGATPAAPAISPSGGFMVQVAAVSTQEIADMEMAALKKFNYAVVLRHEPQDQLLHIQIGPFATKKDAEAMRQDVLSHGFNAIVK